MIDLRHVPFYYLNTDVRRDRQRHMEAQLHGFIHDRVDGTPSKLLPRRDDGRDHMVRAPLGHARVIDHAVRRMGGTFQPFVLCEDDLTWTALPGGTVDLTYPEYADAVYLGISACGAQPAAHDYHSEIVRERSAEFPHLQRIHNMLTAHAVLFLSFRYTMAYFAAMIESCATREPCDCISTRLSATHEVFALGEPLFYQDGAVGGQEMMTRIAWTDDGHGGRGKDGRRYHRVHPYSTLLMGECAGSAFVTLPLCIEDVMAWRLEGWPDAWRLIVCVDRMRRPALYDLIKGELPQAQVLLTDELEPHQLLRLARSVNPTWSRYFYFFRRPGGRAEDELVITP